MAEPEIITEPVEEWRPVVGYEGLYEVSSLGRVRSLPRTVTCPNKLTGGTWTRHWPVGLLSLNIRSGKRDGPRHSVSLCNRGEKSVNVSVLVAAAFLGPRPEGFHICHNDGNPGNDALSNLRYDTAAANAQDAFKHGTRAPGEGNSFAKLTDEIVRTIRAEYGPRKARGLAERYGITKEQVYNIVHRRQWKHLD